MTGRRTNREILTGGKKYVQKQSKKHGVEEVVFDRDSRQDYLTGFHKRKVQRQKKAQEYIKEQDRLAKIADRKRMRDERKQELQERLEKFNETVSKITNYDDSEDEDDNWDGFSEKKTTKNDIEEPEGDLADVEAEEESKPTPKGILRHKEVFEVDLATQFENSDVIVDDDTTVTVESVDNPLIANIRQISLEAKAKANFVDLNKSDEVLEKSIKRAQNYAVTAGVSKPSIKDRIKKKKFRYLTKTERKENLKKQKVKKLRHKRDALSK